MSAPLLSVENLVLTFPAETGRIAVVDHVNSDDRTWRDIGAGR